MAGVPSQFGSTNLWRGISATADEASVVAGINSATGQAAARAAAIKSQTAAAWAADATAYPQGTKLHTVDGSGNAVAIKTADGARQWSLLAFDPVDPATVFTAWDNSPVAARPADRVGLAADDTGYDSLSLEDNRKDERDVMALVPAAQRAGVRAGTSTYDMAARLEFGFAKYKSLWLPKGRIFLSRSIDIPSYSMLAGYGASSEVFNPQTDVNTNKRCITYLGNMHPAAFKFVSPAANQLPCHALDAVAKWSRKVTLSTAGDAAAYSVGMDVFVRHQTEVAIAFQYPLYGRFFKVVAKSGAVLTLDRPCKYAIALACISPVTGTVTDSSMGLGYKMVTGVRLQDFAANARGITSTKCGSYRSRIRRIECRNAEYLWSGNALTDGLLEDISGDFAVRMCEIACYSAGFTVRRMSGHYNGSGTGQDAFAITEQSHDGLLVENECSITAECTDTPYALKINGFDLTFRRNKIGHYGATAGSAVGYIAKNSFTGYGVSGISFDGDELHGASGRTHHLIIGDASGATEVPADLDLNGVRTRGATSTTNGIKFFANARTSLRGCSLALKHEITGGTGQPPLDGGGNVFTSQTAFPGVLYGTGTPEGVVTAAAGTIYARYDITGVLNVCYVKTGSGIGNTGWRVMLLQSGSSVRGDQSFALNDASPQWQIYSSSNLSADRSITVPTVSAALPGVTYYAVKETAGGPGKLQIKNPAGDVLAEIAAASRGILMAIWDGTSWHGYGWGIN